MQEASFTGILRTILFFIVAYYIFKFIGRYLFPIFFQKMVKNVEKKVREQQGYSAREEDVNIGETTIERAPRDNQKSRKDVGEYVDYEEVDE